MRNFKVNDTVTTQAYKGQYETALATARTEQRKAPHNVSYTLEGEGANTVVNKHEVYGGGNPPYQPIVHK